MTSPSGSLNQMVAAASVANTDTAIRTLRVPDEPPVNDPVLARVDHVPGMAN